VTRPRRPTFDPSTIAVLRGAGDGLFEALVASAEPGGPIKVREQRRISAAAMPAWLERHEVGTRLLLLPSAATICRLYALPGMSREHAEQALRLQAESHLLGGVPPHRIAIALLPSDAEGSEAAGDRAGLLLAWPAQAAVEVPPGSGWRVVPEIAALLALPGATTASSPIAWSDPADGSVAVVMPVPKGGVLPRATSEPPIESEPWGVAVRRATAETAMAAGWSPAAAAALAADSIGLGAAEAPGLSLPDDLANRLRREIPTTPGDDIGRLLLGAVLAATGPLRPTTEIVPAAKVERVPWPQRAIDAAVATLSNPRKATIALVAALVVAAVLPLGAAWLRVTILRWKLPDPAAFETAMRTSERQLAVYRELQNQAWPIAKLLGDLSNCLPESIELESVVVAHGEPITIRGIAKPEGGRAATVAILDFEDRLRNTQVFGPVTKRWDPPDSRGVHKFTLSATVARPTLQPRFPTEEDFAERSFAERRYGPAARTAGTLASAESSRPATAEAGADRGDAGESSSSAARRPSAAAPRRTAAAPQAPSPQSPEGFDDRPPSADPTTEAAAASGGEGVLPDRGIGRRRADATTGAGRGVTVPAPVANDPPRVLSDAEIDAMSRAEAQAELARVSRARQSPGLDDQTRERLKSEFDRLLQRAREAQ
jgi:hypothetical protein